MKKETVYAWYLIGFATAGQACPTVDRLVPIPPAGQLTDRPEATAGFAIGVADRLRFDGSARSSFPRLLSEACAEVTRLLDG